MRHSGLYNTSPSIEFFPGVRMDIIRRLEQPNRGQVRQPAAFEAVDFAPLTASILRRWSAALASDGPSSSGQRQQSPTAVAELFQNLQLLRKRK
jgi:hypothetical protein